jgi:pteridine reductase
MELNGKVALVTGGAVRLGKALTLALAGAGARVAVHYGRSAESAATTVAEARALGSEAEAFQADLSEAGRAALLLDDAATRFGRVDILVNSAAIFEPGDLADTTEALWDAHFATNLKAPFFLSQAFAARVANGQPGHIVNIADWRATRPGPHYLAYTLTKAALITMTRSLALALAPTIQVNAIAPGAILPPPGKDREYLERLAEGIPLKRPGSPADVAQALLFLLRSDFVTGELVFVTGGEHL